MKATVIRYLKFREVWKRMRNPEFRRYHTAMGSTPDQFHSENIENQQMEGATADEVFDIALSLQAHSFPEYYFKNLNF